MKAAKWRDLSDDEVKQKARELSEEIFNLRFQISMGVAKSPARVNQARKDRARAATILRERSLTGRPLAPTADAVASTATGASKTRRRASKTRKG